MQRNLRILALLLLVLACCCCICNGQRTFLDTPETIAILRKLRDFAYNFFSRSKGEGRSKEEDARELPNVQELIQDNVPFPCNVTEGRSSMVPNSVHQLRPGDIDVVGTMGDSLLAGAGIFAATIFGIAIENRGVVSTGGGEGNWRKYLTIPNILKEFNPKLFGYAYGDAAPHHKAAQFNVAETGAMSSDTPYMAKVLVERMKNDPRVDMERHWKMVFLMIGANDFCSDLCWVSSPWSKLKSHKDDLLETLRILRDNLPRTFVNLIMPPHLRALVFITGDNPTPKCSITTNFECSCLFGLKYRDKRQEYYEIMSRWQKLEEEIVSYEEFQRDDFTIVAQPILTDLKLPILSSGFPDRSYLSADCFHISQKANARFSNSLWNSMLMPVGEKPRNWAPLFSKFLCPTKERPYLATTVNSRGQNEVSRRKKNASRNDKESGKR
ncbi:phospholipase B1, membrane-associated-like [Prorops nasuta]|uniref:phospholipase B1, membrane-associated-like n=1 Tax=Prorops nasuta TaxID=863751 RepID=UPI0034CE5C02